MFAAKAPLEALLFATPTVGIGTFRCRPDHPLFADSGPSSTYCFVFPRTSVLIQHADGAPFLADPRVVTYYNEGQVYSRRQLSPDGDRGEWFALAPDVAAELVGTIAPPGSVRGPHVFGFSHGPSDAASYLEQRRLIEHLRACPAADPLRVEETVLALLERCVGRAAGLRQPSRPSRRQRDLVEDARLLITANTRRRLRLSDLASRLSCSVFHLCRSFRAVEGTTLHEYQEDLRLRMALERITAGVSDLTAVALDLGYSSHSHFTAAFRRHFGLTPSAFRRRARA